MDVLPSQWEEGHLVGGQWDGVGGSDKGGLDLRVASTAAAT